MHELDKAFRIAALAVAIASWASIGAPVDFVAVALQWGVISAVSSSPERKTFLKALPWLSQHQLTLVAAFISVAVYLRALPLHESLVRSSACLMGELVVGISSPIGIGTLLLRSDDAPAEGAAGQPMLEEAQKGFPPLLFRSDDAPAEGEAGQPMLEEAQKGPPPLAKDPEHPTQESLLASKIPTMQHNCMTDEKANFALQQNRASYLTTVRFLSAQGILALGFAVGDPGTRSRALVVIPCLTLGILFRVWAHYTHDQQRGLLLQGRVAVALISLIQIGLYVNGIYSEGGTTRAVFFSNRMMIVLYMAYSRYSATPLQPLQGAVLIAGAIMHPRLSQFGRPLETILTCTAVVVGGALGLAIENAVRRDFKHQQAEKRLLCETQAQAQVVMQQQLEAESQAAQAEHDKKLESDFFAMTCHEVSSK